MSMQDNYHFVSEFQLFSLIILHSNILCVRRTSMNRARLILVDTEAICSIYSYIGRLANKHMVTSVNFLPHSETFNKLLLQSWSPFNKRIQHCHMTN